MSYTIDLIDTVDDSHVTILHRAAQSSVILKWKGGDNKDEISIVPSSLQFTLIDPLNEDAAFFDLFTTNETRFRVRMYHTQSGDTVWNGFILPDQYSEPYTNGNMFVSFTASDGLGRLNGKFLPDAFYKGEHSVMEIIAVCLGLTGLSLEILFLPAIQNASGVAWHNIYLSGEHLMLSGKRNDAFTVLRDLMNDMVCTVYQCDNRWFVEGLNRRHVRDNDYSRYDSAGSYIGVLPVLKTFKKAVALPVPDITMVPPYKSIEVTHNVADLGFEDDVAVETNKGWAILNQENSDIIASAWAGNGNYNAIARYPDYDVVLPVSDLNVFNFDSWVDLKRKVYLKQGKKYSFKIDFEVLISEGFGNAFVDESIELGAWRRILDFELQLNGLLYARRSLGFANDRQRTVSIDIIPRQDALLNVKIFRPNVPFNNNVVDVVQIKSMTIREIGRVTEVVTEDVISDDYSLIKPITLKFSDDDVFDSTSFRLQRLEDRTAAPQRFTVPIRYTFAQGGGNYVVVGLRDANLIADNLASVLYLNPGYVTANGSSELPILEVLYNYNAGEEMVVRTDILLNPLAAGGNADVLYVDAFKTNDVIGSRATWQQWTDAVYRIERKRYAAAVATVYRRMFSLPHHKIDLEVKQSVKFNDILGFKYLGDGQYPVIDCSWDVSKGRSTVRMVKSFYSDATSDTGNIPPIVDAGPDQVLVHPNTTQATLTAQAFDTDGFIIDRQWQQISGPTTAFIANPTGFITMVQNLVGGEYVFQINVTDNNGATASDTVRVRKVRYYQVSYFLQTLSFFLRRWGLVFTPAIPDNETVRVSGLYDFSQGGQASEQHFKVFKNGVMIVNKVRSGPDDVNGRFEFNYINGNDIVVQVNDARVDMQGHIFLNGIDIAQGPGQILQ